MQFKRTIFVFNPWTTKIFKINITPKKQYIQFCQFSKILHKGVFTDFLVPFR